MAVSPRKEDNNNNEGTMRPIHYLLPLLLGSLCAFPARADTCADLSMQFAGAGRFHMTLGELDELKTCINLILREKISANSNDARGATSPPVTGAGATVEARRPRALPVLQDAE